MQAFQSQRLNYRLIQASDLENLFRLHSNPEVMKFIREPDQKVTDTEVTLRKILNFQLSNPGFGNYAAFIKETNEFIGWGLLIYLENNGLPELGYRLLPKFWNQGLATEIARTLIGFSENELKVKKLVAVTHPQNQKSQRILHKCGFHFIKPDHFYGSNVFFYERIATFKS
jgi:RimJ/RimL family protein N-acetyltransferase